MNRLSRELAALRQRNRELEERLEKAKNNAPGEGPTAVSQESQNGRTSSSQAGTNGQRSTNNVPAPTTSGLSSTMMGSDPGNPSVLLMLDTLRRENEQLRSRLADTEREFVRVRRLNELYREELIECRTRVSQELHFLLSAWLCNLH